jgi:hypothetical protein
MPVKRRLWFYGGVALTLLAFVLYMTLMPGPRHEGALPKASPEVEALSVALRSHVVALSETIGERRVRHGDSLERAERYIVSVAEGLAKQSRTSVRLEELGAEGAYASNVILELPGESPALVIVGAHYDSAEGTPGADDNASGVASTLELARLLSTQRHYKTIRFVLFANEELPYFGTPGMGALAHARGTRKRGEDVSAMLSLESIGYYSESAGSQRYPWPIGLFYGDRGDFVGFVGNLGSRSLVREAIGTFRRTTPFPSEGAALPSGVPGVGWSDHWAFWETGFPAIMVTGTAVFRNPHYHQPTDEAARVDHLKLARVTAGLRHVIEQLAGGD